MKNNRMAILSLMLVIVLAACVATQKNIFETSQSQVALRSIQSRVFDFTDRNRMLRTVIATLQDLGFIIDNADETLGTVSGTKLAGYVLRMTVSVRPKGNNQMIVRSSAQYNLEMVEDPEPYQQFFLALSKALFLEVNVNSMAAKPHGSESPTAAKVMKDGSKSEITERHFESLYPKKIAHSFNIFEPWTGLWKVTRDNRRGTWSLKQVDRKVVSTENSRAKIEGLATGDQLEGKYIMFDHNHKYPFTVKMSSDGLSFNGTTVDYLGRSIVQIKGERKE